MTISAKPWVDAIAAETALQKVDPANYAKSRNFFTGAVTRLSPYIRYGILSLAEIRDYVRDRDPPMKQS